MTETITTPRRALDLDFVIRTDEPALTAYLDRAFACLPEATGPPAELRLAREADDGFRVTGPEGRGNPVEGAGAALAVLVSALNRAVSGASTSAILVHAAGVQGPGGCLLLPAKPTAGKSTLAAGLTARGWRYLSDEVVAIDPDTLHARPYPRPLTLKRGSWPVLPELRPQVDPAAEPFLERLWMVAPDRIRPDPVASGGPVVAVAFPAYVEGATSRLGDLSRADALHGLVEACFNLDRRGRHGFHALAELVRGTDVAALTTGDLHEACAALEERYATLGAQ